MSVRNRAHESQRTFALDNTGPCAKLQLTRYSHLRFSACEQGLAHFSHFLFSEKAAAAHMGMAKAKMGQRYHTKTKRTDAVDATHWLHKSQLVGLPKCESSFGVSI